MGFSCRHSLFVDCCCLNESLVNVSWGKVKSIKSDRQNFSHDLSPVRGLFDESKKGNESVGKKVIQTATERQNKLFQHFKKIIIANFYLSDEEWEKDLAAEIQDFEVVDDNVDESDLDDLK